MSRIHCMTHCGFLAASLMLLAVASPGGSRPAMAQTANSDTPVNIVADQIRRQGYKCDKPRSAERDVQASRPDAPMWVLTCEDATYRVRLKADMAAEVEKVK